MAGCIGWALEKESHGCRLRVLHLEMGETTSETYPDKIDQIFKFME